MKRLGKTLLLVTLLVSLVPSMGQVVFAVDPPDVTNLKQDIFEAKDDNLFVQKLTQIVRLVGGIGGTAFTLAFMILTGMMVFASISPRHRGMFWAGIISCFVAAFLFFSSYVFAEAIAKLAIG